MVRLSVEPNMSKNRPCRLLLLSATVAIGLAGCGSSASQVNAGESVSTTAVEEPITAEVADPFGPLRAFMVENAPSGSLFDSIDLVPALDNGRRFLVSVFAQPDGSDAYVLSFLYKPSCSHIPGVLTPAGSDSFVWTEGRPEAGGIEHESIHCPPDWQFEPTLDGRPTQLEISVDGYEADALTLTIDGSTERWTITTDGG